METKTIRINTTHAYNVTVGSGVLTDSGRLIAEAAGCCRVAIITDTTVAKLYLAPVEESLDRAGLGHCRYIFPAGEQSKTLPTLTRILEFLAENRLTRSDCLLALGGGVTGDIAGFAAGCYLRGLRLVQMPTTLLAAVDSSVGGKTAVNLEAGKNLAGLIVQPAAVICDTDCLATLIDEVFASGAAEAIKTAILADPKLFSLFEMGNVKDNLTEIIATCVAIKGSVVATDEFDLGARQQLNLGHTVGHAVEKCSDYAIPHGQAVAIGLTVISRAAAKLGYCDEHSADRIAYTLKRNGLPVSSPFGAAELAEAALADKKRAGDTITLVFPRRIGSCRLEKIPISGLLSVLSAGLEE